VAFLFRLAQESDAEAISALIHRALLPETLPGWMPVAVERLLGDNSAQSLREFLKRAAFSLVCVHADAIVGFITSKLPRLISLVAVDPAFQRAGVGSQLVERLLQHISMEAREVSVVEVSATEYSFPFYRRLGFYPLSEFIDYEGCRFARLGYWRKNPLQQKRES